MCSFILILVTLAGQWQFQLGSSPRGESHLINDRRTGRNILLLPLGSAGLGAWTGRGESLPGFPLSAEDGVILRPAGIETSAGTSIVYADNTLKLHMVDLNGTERSGWPVTHDCNIVTGVSVVDLDDDGNPEIAYGTGDGNVHLRNIHGTSISGFPVDLGSRLQYQPTMVDLGGGRGNGLLCTTNNSRLELLSRSGTGLPGWPRQLPVPAGTIPVSGDIDGDGSSDIIAATQDGRVHVFTLLGEELEGWPFRMDARPVSGVPALGNLSSDGISLQIAIASVDSLVYLLDSDGRLAGTWRWPDKVDARPWQPLICTTDAGQAVVAVTHSGEVNAWNGNGRLLAGYPVETGPGCIAPPVAADLDGDGATELITVSPTGSVQTTRLSSIAGNAGSWPMALRDQFNSGAFSRGPVPGVSVEQLTGEFQGPVTLGYSLTGQGSTGITVSYSTDAGYTWIETDNCSITSESVTWFSEQDLPSMDLRTCMLKITPITSSAPGESGTSGLLHIDNNQPPVLMLSNPLPQNDGTVILPYSLQDMEGDPISIEGVYSSNDGITWNLLDLSGPVQGIEPSGYGEPVTLTPPPDQNETTMYRIRASDADPGPWFTFDGLTVSSSCAPAAQIIAPEGEAAGDVEFGLRFSSPASASEIPVCQYSTDMGESWHRATLKDSVASDSTGMEFTLIWDSFSDVPQLDCETVQLQALPSPGCPGVPVPSAVFHLDNNSPPRCRIDSPERYDLFRGLVPVTFTVVDPEWDQVTLDLQYRLFDRSDSWHSAEGVMNDRVIDPSRYSTTLNWNSSADLPDVTMVEIELRLMASDEDPAWSEIAGPVTLANSDIPEVMSATVSSFSSVLRTMEVAFELSDPDERQLTLTADYSTDGGRTWKRASATVTPAVLSRGSYSGSLVWNYGSSGLDSEEVLLRLTPFTSGNKPGKPRIIQRELR